MIKPYTEQLSSDLNQFFAQKYKNAQPATPATPQPDSRQKRSDFNEMLQLLLSAWTTQDLSSISTKQAFNERFPKITFYNQNTCPPLLYQLYKEKYLYPEHVSMMLPFNVIAINSTSDIFALFFNQHDDLVLLSPFNPLRAMIPKDNPAPQFTTSPASQYTNC